MTLKKLTLTEENHTIDFSNSEALQKEYSNPKSTYLRIELIEIKGIDNPSRLTLSLRGSNTTVNIALYKHRTNFLYQNEIFLLDTNNLLGFQIDTTDIWDVLLRATSENQNDKFTIVMYGYTDQEIQLDEENENKNPV